MAGHGLANRGLTREAKEAEGRAVPEEARTVSTMPPEQRENAAPTEPTAARGFAEGRNRRVHERLDLDKPVRVHEIGAFDAVDGGIDGTAVDVSRAGMGISTRKMMHIGRRVIVLVPSPEGPCKALFGTVAYSAYKEGGRYHIGVRLCPNPGSPVISTWLRAQKAT